MTMNTLITMMMLTATGMAVVIAAFSWKKWGPSTKNAPADPAADPIVTFLDQIKDKHVS